MILFSPDYLKTVVDNCVILLDNGKDVPEMNDVVTVYMKSGLDYEPYVKVTAGNESASVLKVLLATLDDCMYNTGALANAIGAGCLMGHRIYPKCRTNEEAIASVISNLVQLGVQHSLDVISVGASLFAVPSEGFTIEVESLFQGKNYQPNIVICHGEEVLYEGDPGKIIIFSGE